VGPLAVLQKAWPVLRLELLLAQDELDAARGVVHLAVLRINFGVQVKGDMVFLALQGRSCKRDIGRGDVKVGLFLGNIGNVDVDVEEVASSVSAGGALRPSNCTKYVSVSSE